MKYIKLEASFTKSPNCANNLNKALKEIGRKDPLQIKRFTLKRNHKNDNNNPTEKQLINRGILNVRKSLNGNLGSHGKFSNRMIKKTAEIKKNKKNKQVCLLTQLPYKDYLRITLHTYFLLYQVNKDFCSKLLEIEKEDQYPFKDSNNSVATKSITPVQTNIVIRSECNDYSKKEFISFIKRVTA